MAQIHKLPEFEGSPEALLKLLAKIKHDADVWPLADIIRSGSPREMESSIDAVFELAPRDARRLIVGVQRRSLEPLDLSREDAERAAAAAIGAVEDRGDGRLDAFEARVSFYDLDQDELSWLVDELSPPRDEDEDGDDEEDEDYDDDTSEEDGDEEDEPAATVVVIEFTRVKPKTGRRKAA